MKRELKNNKKILMSVVFVLFFLSYNTAKADFYSNLSSGISDLLSIVSHTDIFKTIKTNYCSQYKTSVASGEWQSGEFKTDLGKALCDGYVEANNQSTSTPSSFVSPLAIKPTKATTSLAAKLSNTVKQVESNSVENNVPQVNTLVDLTEDVGNTLNKSQIIYWTNIERTKNDTSLVYLGENSLLTQMAGERVKDMFSKVYFEHVSPTGDNVSKMATRDGYNYINIGENIALGNFGTSRDLVVAWMNSPGHRANILNNKYTEIGVYAEQGMYNGQSVWIAAQVFGRPLANCTQPDISLKTEILGYTSDANSINNNIASVKALMATLINTDTAAYNKKVIEYNSLASSYNSLVTKIKALTNEYNQGVTKYNNCIK